MLITAALTKLRNRLDDGVVKDATMTEVAIVARDDTSIPDDAFATVNLGVRASKKQILALNETCLKVFRAPIPSDLKLLYEEHDGIWVSVSKEDPRVNERVHRNPGILTTEGLAEELAHVADFMGDVAPILPFHRAYDTCWHGYTKQSEIVAFSLDGLHMKVASSLGEWLELWAENGFWSWALDSDQPEDFLDYEG